MEPLAIFWFVTIVVLWTGYLLLEGFDLGVGMHMLVSTKSDRDRRVMLNTIGPVWDGNEVWLITAGAATFAAFPAWYASLFSALYVPLTIALVGLIIRVVGIEYRGKVASEKWTEFWTWMVGIGSFIVAFCVGALLAITSTGLPLNDNGDRVGGPFVWLTVPAVLGGLGVVGFSLVHGATFLALKSDGPVRVRAAAFTRRFAPALLLPLAGWAIYAQLDHGLSVVPVALTVLAVVGAVLGWVNSRKNNEGFAFIGYAAFGALGAASIFTSLFPKVLPSTLDSAFDLTIMNASNSPYTLGVMTVITVVSLPVILIYQAWTYWIFRQRITPGMIPDAHIVLPAILRPKEEGAATAN